MAARVRRFDHQAALERHRAGETYAQIAASLGVNQNAVRQAVLRQTDPAAVERLRAYHRDLQRRHLRRPCVRGCGRLAWHTGPLRGVCRTCSTAERAVSVREDTLRCCECGQWQPDEAFPHARARISRRERHSVCRSCQAAARQRSRERHKTPCATCGAPRLHDPRSGQDSGLCRDCYIASLRVAA